jgi:hypothetical protein
LRGFLKQCKHEYYSIGLIVCAAQGSEKIYFDNAGFNHLLRKGRKFRSIQDQKRRFGLLKRATRIIRASKMLSYREVKTDNRIVEYWALCEITKRKKVTVIMRRVNNGRTHFYSVFDG